MVVPASESPRRAYVKPVLTAHGTLANVTRAVGNTGLMDGGLVMSMRKTGP